MAWPPATHQDVQDEVEKKIGRRERRTIPGEAGIPTVMASPPTFTFVGVGNPSSTITSAVAWSAISSSAPNTAAFSFRGGPWMQKSGDPTYATPSTALTGGEGPNFPYVEFQYYGTAFEFGYKGQGTLDNRVWVDGKLAENAYTADTTQDGAVHLRKVTFGSAGWRRIRLDVTHFWGVNTGPNDVVTPAPSAGDRLLVIHDSYGEGVNASFYRGYAALAGWMLGFDETVGLSQGGTGVLAVNAGAGRPKYRDRSADWAQVNASVVLIGMSINDDSFTTTALATEFGLLLTAVEALPTVKEIWVMGRVALNAGDYSWAVSRDAPMQTVAAAHGATFVSLTSPASIWTGSGNAGSPTGSGSGDVLWSADGVHPTTAGHEGIARVFVDRLVTALNA